MGIRAWPYLFIILSWGKLYATPSTICHPQMNTELPQYIIGYGSLLLEQSKAQTIGASGVNLPVIVKGYERGWFLRAYLKKQPTTFLGVRANNAAAFNGVVFKLRNKAQIIRLDLREQGYCRQLIHVQQLQFLGIQPLTRGQFWLYVPQRKFIAYPTFDFPISEYYLNLFIAGCIQVERKNHLQGYAKQCIKTTSSWRDFRQFQIPHDFKPIPLNLQEVNKFKFDALIL
jgi:hypothetical protein